MSTNKENRLIHPPIKTWQYFIIFLGILLLWLLNWILPIACMDDWSEIGNFGSMFGAVNTLFSGFAFALLIIAIYLQRHEIKIQHEELKNQNQELKNQNYELGLTREVFEQQKFESTFFKLIEMYWKYYGELVYEGTHANFSGISAVNGNLNEINRLIKHPNSIEKKYLNEPE